MRGQDFYLFDIFDIDASRYLGRAERQEVVAGLHALGVTVHEVPWLENMTLERFAGDVSKVLDYAEGRSLNPATAREGVVFKRLDGSMSFKAISNTYLLKHRDR